MDKEQQQQTTKVERFLKLGYAHGDILRVLESLRQDAQTNDILEELIKTCSAPAAKSHAPSHRSHALPDSPKLVSRGCSPSHGPAGPPAEAPGGFRPVVIDGSNVAMSHGGRKVFSCRGLQLAVDWFWDKGLRDVTLFVPLWRKEAPRPENLVTDQHILHELERRKILVYTPSRSVNGKRVVCYDDRYIVKLAVDLDGIIVSNDNYRDLQTENPQWKKFIEERLLMYSFVNDKFMPPDDPLGRNGPSIDDFLRKKPWTPDSRMQHCPYGKKCTYGVKCKFYHPERTSQSQLSVADELRALRDRARNPAATTPPPPPLSLDVDEAFGSMEASLSRLYLQDGNHSLDRRLLSASSGVASCSLGRDDVSLGGGGGGVWIGGGAPAVCPSAGFHRSCPSCSGYHCGRQQPRMPSLQQPAWSSCPAPPPHGSVEQNPRPAHSLPREPWPQAGGGGGGGRGGGGSPAARRRKELRSQLSTLFPQNMVERVMDAHPHVSDMAKLVSLLQGYRSSHASF